MLGLLLIVSALRACGSNKMNLMSEGLGEVMMKTLKGILRLHNPLLLLLFAGLSVSAQPQGSESVILMAKGHGTISSAVDERKVTSALVVLRQNGTVLITITADLQLLAEGTWKANDTSSGEIVLKITGGALKGEVIGSGKLLLTSDGKSIKELTVKVRSSDGQEISVTFVANDSEARLKEEKSQGTFSCVVSA